MNKNINTCFDINNEHQVRIAIMCFLLQQPRPYIENLVKIDDVLTVLWPHHPLTEKLRIASLAILRNLEIEGLVSSIQPAPPDDGRALLVYASIQGQMFVRPNAWAEGVEAFHALPRENIAAMNPYPSSINEHADWLEGVRNASAWGGTSFVEFDTQ